jgi:hypothetical protein
MSSERASQQAFRSCTPGCTTSPASTAPWPRPKGTAFGDLRAPGSLKAAELEGPYRTERFEPCSLRLRAALPNSAPSGFLASSNLLICPVPITVPKWAWFGCVRERDQRETGNGPKRGLEPVPVVRVNEPKGRHPAGFRPARSATKRMSRLARLAERERFELSVGPGRHALTVGECSLVLLARSLARRSLVTVAGGTGIEAARQPLGGRARPDEAPGRRLSAPAGNRRPADLDRPGVSSPKSNAFSG